MINNKCISCNNNYYNESFIINNKSFVDCHLIEEDIIYSTSLISSSDIQATNNIYESIIINNNDSIISSFLTFNKTPNYPSDLQLVNSFSENILIDNFSNSNTIIYNFSDSTTIIYNFSKLNSDENIVFDKTQFYLLGVLINTGLDQNVIVSFSNLINNKKEYSGNLEDKNEKEKFVKYEILNNSSELIKKIIVENKKDIINSRARYYLSFYFILKSKK